jgi:hypothetical protein
MPDDTSTPNTNKLFEISTRIDERVKSVQEKQHELEVKLAEIMKEHNDGLQKIAVLESKDDCVNVCGIHHVVDHLDQAAEAINELDKRMMAVELASDNTKNRWKQATTFIIQLIWVLLASWLLLKLNLQAPAVPKQILLYYLRRDDK